MRLTSRKIFLAVFIACAGLLGFGLFLQHVKGLEPCPLCVLQRYAFVAVALTALLAAIHAPQGFVLKLDAAFLALFAGTGIGLAGRHVWLEHLPKDRVPACGPGFDYLIESFPLSKVLPMIFKGSGECAEVKWRLLHLSISEWALLWFVIFLLVAAWLMLRRKGA